LGYAFGHLQRHEEAAREIQESNRLHPNWPNTLCALGVSLAALGQFDKAVTAYLQAIQLSPMDADTHFNLGVA
jgi:Flp pilus assembly protein TadD